MKKLISLPSLLALGLLFGRAHADDGRAIAGFWPAASDVGATGAAKAAGSGTAKTPPTPPTPPKTPTAPTAGTPPTPPTPPAPPSIGGIPKGINISIHDGKVTVDGIDKFVDDQINAAMKGVDSPGVPPEVQKKMHEKLEKMRGKLKARLAHVDGSNIEAIGDQLGDIGDEIGAEMDEFGSDMDAWGDKFGKDMAKKFAFHGHDDDDLPEPPDADDADDVDQAVRDLGDLSLNPDQRAKISALRADSDAKVATAKHALDAASEKLQKLLSDPKADEAQVSAAIDAVTVQESAIRKARLLAWVRARTFLDATQRAKVEKAAAGKKTK